ncbi:MAG: DUF2807 domain-containing protein [Pseudomonadota bacterium]
MTILKQCAAAAAAIMAGATAQAAERTYPADETITGLKAARGVVVRLIPGDEQQIRASTDATDFDELVVEVKKGVLTVSRKMSFNIDTSPRYEVEVTLGEIDYLKTATGSVVEAGSFALGDLVASIDTGSVATISGSCDELDVEVSTGGVFEADGLQCSSVRAKASMGGVAEVYASADADATARMGGVVTIAGSPESVQKNKMMGGVVEVK